MSPTDPKASGKGTTPGRPAGPAVGRPGPTTGSTPAASGAANGTANGASANGVPKGAPRPATPPPAAPVRPAAAPTRPAAAPARPGAPGPGAVVGPAGRPGQAPAQRPTAQQPATRPEGAPAKAPAATTRPGMPRKVRLNVARLDPWSVLKLSFLLSVGIGIATVVATFVVWQVLNGMGVFTDVNGLIQDVAGATAVAEFDLYTYVGRDRVLSLATVIAVANVILLTALSTLGAFLYNLASGLVGGLHVTLSDD